MIPRVLSLCSILLSGTFLITVTALVSLDSQAPSSNQEVCQTSVGFPLLQQHPGNSLQAVSWGNCRANLICFLSLRNPCHLFTNVQCLENHNLTYFASFVCLFFCFLVYRRVILIPVSPSWPKVEVHALLVSPWNVARANWNVLFV